MYLIQLSPLSLSLSTDVVLVIACSPAQNRSALRTIEKAKFINIITAFAQTIAPTLTSLKQRVPWHVRKRADEADLDIYFDVGTEDLPYSNNSFDVVISLIGAMFAPRPEKVVSECARVLKTGGKLFMANWTSASMPAKMFKCVSKFAPPPASLAPLADLH